MLSLFASEKIPEITPREAWTLLSELTSAWRIIDVRERGELDETGTPPGATHIPLGDVLTHGVPFEKTTPLIVICRSGRRSALAVKKLIDDGYIDVRNLAGGIIAWMEDGLPISDN